MVDWERRGRKVTWHSVRCSTWPPSAPVRWQQHASVSAHAGSRKCIDGNTCPPPGPRPTLAAHSTSMNSMNAKRMALLGSPQMRQSRILPQSEKNAARFSSAQVHMYR